MISLELGDDLISSVKVEPPIQDFGAGSEKNRSSNHKIRSSSDLFVVHQQIGDGFRGFKIVLVASFSSRAPPHIVGNRSRRGPESN